VLTRPPFRAIPGIVLALAVLVARAAGIGSCGVPRPSLGGYITEMGPRTRRRCALLRPSAPVRSAIR